MDELAELERKIHDALIAAKEAAAEEYARIEERREGHDLGTGEGIGPAHSPNL